MSAANAFRFKQTKRLLGHKTENVAHRKLWQHINGTLEGSAPATQPVVSLVRKPVSFTEPPKPPHRRTKKDEDQ